MASYEIDEGRMIVPEGWEDRTVNSLEYVGQGGALKVAVSRHIHKDRPLKAIVTEVVTDMGRRLAGFEVLGQDDLLLDAEPAIELRARFKDGAETFEQRSLWFLVGAKCVTVGTLWSPKTATAGEALFAQIRGSIRRRARDEESVPLGAAPPPGPPPRTL